MRFTETDAPLLTQAAVTTAELVVHVVDERPLSPVFEEDSHDAGSARYDRGHDLDYGAEAPLFVVRVEYAVSQTKKEPFLVVEHAVTNVVGE
jgi:hypothetical protein